MLDYSIPVLTARKKSSGFLLFIRTPCFMDIPLSANYFYLTTMKKEAFIQSGDGDEQAYRVAYLIAGYIRESLTQQEHQELDDWVTASMDNQRLFEELTDER